MSGRRRPVVAWPSRRAAQVGRLLSTLEPSGRSQRPLQPVSGERDREVAAAGLRTVLETLGSGFAAFGLYLAVRADLLPAGACDELGRISDRAPAEDLTLLAQASPWAEWSTVPCESRILFQVHRARLRDGTDVRVKVVRPSARLAIEDRDLLGKLQPAFVAMGGVQSHFSKAVEHFEQWLDHSINLRSECEALHAMSEGRLAFDLAATPEPVSELCDERMLVTIAPQAGRQLSPDSGRTLVAAWLWHALQERRFPSDPGPGSVVLLPGGQVMFTDGPWTEISPESQDNLRQYLMGMESQDSERVISCLLREFVPVSNLCNDSELQRNLKQLVPFRDGRWSQVGRPPQLADHVLTGWALASRNGRMATGATAEFIRGLCALLRMTREVFPESDALAEGLRDLRIWAGWGQVREKSNLPAAGEWLDQHSALWLDLPQQIDRLLNSATANGLPFRVQLDGEAPQRSRGADLAAVVIGCVALVALVWRLRPEWVSSQGSQFPILIAICGLGLWRVLSPR